MTDDAEAATFLGSGQTSRTATGPAVWVFPVLLFGPFPTQPSQHTHTHTHQEARAVANWAFVNLSWVGWVVFNWINDIFCPFIFNSQNVWQHKWRAVLNAAPAGSKYKHS